MSSQAFIQPTLQSHPSRQGRRGVSTPQPVHLLAYAGDDPRTHAMVRDMADTMRRAGLTVDVRPVHTIRSLEGYTSAIIGSTTDPRRWPPSPTACVLHHSDALRRIPLAFFCIGPANATRRDRNQLLAWLQPICDLVPPTEVGVCRQLEECRHEPFLRRFLMRIKPQRVAA